MMVKMLPCSSHTSEHVVLLGAHLGCYVKRIFTAKFACNYVLVLNSQAVQKCNNLSIGCSNTWSYHNCS